MSCNEWEEGSIVIPKAQFSKFYKDFVKGYNTFRTDELTNLKSFRQQILDAGKGKRGFNFRGEAEEMVHRKRNVNDAYLMVYKLFKDNVTKPVAVTKKMVDFANTKTTDFEVSGGEAYIVFNKAKHTVHWSVHENNHACDTAHNTHEAKLFFRLLRGITWKRNSGGEIIGNDEYNQDNYEAGGGANYTKMTFGK